MAITKIQSGAIPADAIDTTHIGDVGADKITGQVVSSQISDLSVTHAKLHTTMDLSSKTVTLPSAITDTITNKLPLAGGTMTGNLNIDVADLFVKDTTGGAQGQVQIGAGTAQGFINIQKGDGTRTVQLNSDGTSYLTGGNVGIGTSSPNKISGHTMLSVNTATATQYAGVDISTADAVRSAFYANNGGTYLETRTSTPLVLGTNTTERMRIESNGSVKVKNAADDASQFIFNDGWSSEARNIRVWAEEEVSGGIGRWFSFLGTNVSKDGDGTYTKPSDDSASNWGNIAGMLFTGANAAGQNAIDFIVDLPSAHGGGLNVGMSGSNLYNKSAMSITADGKVGIGTTSPVSDLHVDGSIVSTNLAQGTGQLQLQGYGATGYINHSGAGSLRFRMGSSYTEHMSLAPGGQFLASAAGRYTGLNSNAWVTFGRLYSAQSTPLNIKVIVGHNSSGGYSEFTNDTYAYNIAAGTVVTIGNTTGGYTCQIRKIKRIGGDYSGGDGGWEYQVARNQGYSMSVGLHVMGATTGFTWTI